MFMKKTVKLYSTKTCPFCLMEKNWLEEEKIDHKIIYVDQNQDAARKIVQKTGQIGVPVTEIKFEDGREEYVIGFNKDLLKYYLKS
jgi:glutaredoxin